MRKAGALVLAGVAALVLVLGVAPAGAVTFGANLARTPDNAATCVNLQLIVNSPTCTVESTNLATGESGFPPAGDGIVTNVRLRVGPRTGPMQIVLEQALRQPNPFEPGKPNYACCTLIDASPVFTPTANAVTTVPVNFRVLQSTTPDENGYYVDQHLALSVLDPTVPIPASLNPSAFVGAWFPAWSQIGELKVGPSGSPLQADVLMSAEWQRVSRSTGGSTGGGTPTPLPTVPGSPLQLPQAIRPVRNDRAFIPLLCGRDTACVGRLLLQSRQGGAAARLATVAARKKKGQRSTPTASRARAGDLTYASVKFRVPAGKSKTIRAKLGKAGKRLLRKHKRAKVWLNVRMSGASVGTGAADAEARRQAEARQRQEGPQALAAVAPPGWVRAVA